MSSSIVRKKKRERKGDSLDSARSLYLLSPEPGPNIWSDSYLILSKLLFLLGIRESIRSLTTKLSFTDPRPSLGMHIGAHKTMREIDLQKSKK